MSERTASDDEIVTRNQEQDLHHPLSAKRGERVSLETESSLRRVIERLKRMVVPSRTRRDPPQKSG
ncbi:MAG: hypothetical protein K5872_01025 [Rhizobiaceae bacterium]|nr:hypothetical protein [Rhizobiaceae bacterium]MCV0404792.1 hypothetical protein [Rhizobiaceae bacterium]